MADPAQGPFSRLLCRAFHRGPGPRANTLIQKIRDRLRDPSRPGLSYEIVLTGRDPLYLTRELAPRLALYMREKRLGLDAGSPLFLSVFWGETLFFLRPADLAEEARLALGLSPEAFKSLWQRWGRTGRAAAGALPPPSGAGQGDDP